MDDVSHLLLRRRRTDENRHARKGGAWALEVISRTWCHPAPVELLLLPASCVPILSCPAEERHRMHPAKFCGDACRSSATGGSRRVGAAPDETGGAPAVARRHGTGAAECAGPGRRHGCRRHRKSAGRAGRPSSAQQRASRGPSCRGSRDAMGATNPSARRARVCRGQGGADVPRASRRAAAERQRPSSGRHSEACRGRPGDQMSTALMSSACATNSPPSSASRAEPGSRRLGTDGYTVQVFRTRARSFHAVIAASRMSFGSTGRTPSIMSTSRMP